MSKATFFELEEELLKIGAKLEQINAIALMLGEQISASDKISSLGASAIVTLSDIADSELTEFTHLLSDTLTFEEVSA